MRMFIEFQLPRQQHAVAPNLRAELQQWAYQHRVDYHSIRTEHRSDLNQERVYLPNERALELFAISWRPQNPQLADWRFRR